MKIFNKLVDFLFPNSCMICGGKINERYTCRKCLNIIKYYHEKIDVPVNKDDVCSRIISAIPHKGVMKEKIWHYKFRGDKYLAPVFAEILSMKVDKYCSDSDLIVPVPISWERLKERGYNQSELIAKYLSEITKINYQKNILVKIKNNLRQSELTLNKRKENVKDAYSIKNIDAVKNKKIILLDDVYTTGATINECAKVLKKAGAKDVTGLTVMYGGLEI